MGEHKRQLCPCGSGKHRKACCLAFPRGTRLELEESARRLSRAGRHAEAFEYLEERVALNPENPLIWNDLGNEYAAAGDFDNAISALKRGHEADPGHPLPLYNLGVHLLNRARELPIDKSSSMATEAVRFFRLSLALDPENAAAHHNIAMAYGILQDTHRAGIHLAEALRLQPALEGDLGRLVARSGT